MPGFEAGLQLLITFIPLLIGGWIGASLGVFYARWLRRRIEARGTLRRMLLLFPWRSVVVVLPFVAFFIPMVVGMGPVSGALIVVVFVLLFTLPFTTSTLLNAWFPLPVRLRLLSLGRIIAVSAISVAAATGVVGGFSAGVSMFQALQQLQYAQFFNVFYMVFAIALLVDVLLGVITYVFYRPEATGVVSGV